MADVEGFPGIPRRSQYVDHQEEEEVEDDSSSIIGEDRCLGFWDVFALVVNKMIGAGIYFAASQIILLLKCKVAALMLWLFGFLYSLCSVVIYLYYGCKWPFTGGEFIYITKLFPKPPIIMSCAYAYFFVGLSSAAGNSIIFSEYVVSQGKPRHEQEWLYKFIACSVVIVISWVHYAVGDIGLLVNKLLAFLKIAILFFTSFVGIGAGVNNIRKHQGLHNALNAGWKDFGQIKDKTNGLNVCLALILVLYSFQGWENANYIVPKIGSSPEERQKLLKRGVFAAIITVGVLYFLFNLFVMLVLDFDEIVYDPRSVLLNMLNKAFSEPGETNERAVRGVSGCIAISAIGNLVGTIYTNAQVKREIARYQLIPFWRWFARSTRSKRTFDNEGAPTGGLILHGIVSSIIIIATPIYTDSNEGLSFIVSLFTYGHSLLGVFLGIGFVLGSVRWGIDYRVRMNDIYCSRVRTLDDDHRPTELNPFPKLLQRSIVRLAIGTFFIAANTFVVVVPWISSTNPDGSRKRISSLNLLYANLAVWLCGAGAGLLILCFPSTVLVFQMPDKQSLEANPDVDPTAEEDVFVFGGESYVAPHNRRWKMSYPKTGFGRFLGTMSWGSRYEYVKEKAPMAWTFGFNATSNIWSNIKRGGESEIAEEIRQRYRSLRINDSTSDDNSDMSPG